MGGAYNKSGMYRHFAFIHPKADILISEDEELEKCVWCGMRMAFPDRHSGAYTCRKVEERNRRRKNSEEKRGETKEGVKDEKKENNVLAALIEVEERTISKRDISKYARDLRRKIRETEFNGKKGDEDRKQLEDWAGDRDWIKGQIRIEWEREALRREWRKGSETNEEEGE